MPGPRLDPRGFHVHTRSETTEGHVGVGLAAGLSGLFLGLWQGGWVGPSPAPGVLSLPRSVLKERGHLLVAPARRSGPALAWMPPGPGSLPTHPAHCTWRPGEGRHTLRQAATSGCVLPWAHHVSSGQAAPLVQLTPGSLPPLPGTTNPLPILPERRLRPSRCSSKEHALPLSVSRLSPLPPAST